MLTEHLLCILCLLTVDLLMLFSLIRKMSFLEALSEEMYKI